MVEREVDIGSSVSLTMILYESTGVCQPGNALFAVRAFFPWWTYEFAFFS